MNDIPTLNDILIPEDEKPINQFHKQLLRQVDTSEAKQISYDKSVKINDRQDVDWY